MCHFQQVDYALELVNLGIERGVIGLDVLQNDLITMETLVYECHIEDSLALDDIQNMPDIDKIRLMMSRVGENVTFYSKLPSTFLEITLHIHRPSTYGLP